MRFHIGCSFNLKKVFKPIIFFLIGILGSFAIFHSVKADEIEDNSDTINQIYVLNNNSDDSSNLDFTKNYPYFGGNLTTLETLNNIYILNFCFFIFCVCDRILILIKKR